MTHVEHGSRTVVLIDGSHVDRLRSKLGCPLDIGKLADFFGSDEVPAAVIYYRDARDMDEYTPLIPTAPADDSVGLPLISLM